MTVKQKLNRFNVEVLSTKEEQNKTTVVFKHLYQVSCQDLAEALGAKEWSLTANRKEIKVVFTF